MGRANKKVDQVLLQTTYKPEYCEKIIEMGKDGKSLAEFCSEVGICEDTSYHWAKRFPRFKEAKALWRTHSKAYWCKFGHDNVLSICVIDKEDGTLTTTRMDTNLYKFITGGRFGMSHQPDIHLPNLTKGALSKRHQVALKALAEGKITPNQAATISTMLKNSIDIETYAELRAEIAKLESKINTLQSTKMVTKVADEPEYEVINDTANA